MNCLNDIPIPEFSDDCCGSYEIGSRQTGMKIFINGDCYDMLDNYMGKGTWKGGVIDVVSTGETKDIKDTLKECCF